MGEIYRALEALAKYLGADPIAAGHFARSAPRPHVFPVQVSSGCPQVAARPCRSRERLAAHGGWRSAYFGLLRRALTWVDCQLGPSARSADSYEFTLNMALIYPVASLFIVWVVTAQNTSGISALLPSDLPLSGRAIFVSGVCACAFFYYRFLTSSDWQKWANAAVAGVAGAAVSAGFGSLGVIAVVGAGTSAFAGYGAFAFAAGFRCCS